MHECLIEESVLGWKEYELEVMRDLADNVIIICSIENFDPMGVHTCDSITVAPAQTLTDREYQRMRDAAIAVMRRSALRPADLMCSSPYIPEKALLVIEMNRACRDLRRSRRRRPDFQSPRWPQAGRRYTLDEIPNDITRKTPACVSRR